MLAKSILAGLLVAASPGMIAAEDQQWESPDGGNLIIEGSSQLINYGYWHPFDVVDQLKKKCSDGSISCDKEEAIEVETDTVEGETKKRLNIKVTIELAEFPQSGWGSSEGMRGALWEFMNFEKTYRREVRHWKAGNAGRSCWNAADSLCYMDTGDEGDDEQFLAPNHVWLRYEDGDRSASLQIRIETYDPKEDEGSEYCENLVGAAGDLAGVIKDAPTAGFTLASYLCKLFGA